MKPEQFIREYGVEKAREALTLCCWMDGSFCTRLWHGCVQNNHECCVDVKDIKRLVELLGLVQTYGGIVMAKRQLDLFLRVNLEQGTMLSNTVSKLKDAVAAHESIYGGGDE